MDIPSFSAVDTFNWCDKGCVLPVQDRLTTESDWAFSAIDIVYAAHHLHGKTPAIQPSVQFLINNVHLRYRTQSTENLDATESGLPNSLRHALEFLKNDRTPDDASMEFIGKCDHKRNQVPTPVPHEKRIFINDYEFSKDMDVALEWLQNEGPIGMEIWAPNSFMSWPEEETDGYRPPLEGVYVGPRVNEWNMILKGQICSYAVTVVGRGTAQNVRQYDGTFKDVDYLIAKNSRGTTWGDNGYVKISLDIDRSFFCSFVLPKGIQERQFRRTTGSEYQWVSV